MFFSPQVRLITSCSPAKRKEIKQNIGSPWLCSSFRKFFDELYCSGYRRYGISCKASSTCTGSFNNPSVRIEKNQVPSIGLDLFFLRTRVGRGFIGIFAPFKKGGGLVSTHQIQFIMANYRRTPGSFSPSNWRYLERPVSLYLPVSLSLYVSLHALTRPKYPQVAPRVSTEKKIKCFITKRVCYCLYQEFFFSMSFGLEIMCRGI